MYLYFDLNVYLIFNIYLNLYFIGSGVGAKLASSANKQWEVFLGDVLLYLNLYFQYLFVFAFIFLCFIS